MGQFMVQLKGSAILVTFPYASSLERGSNMATTEDWLMELPPASFNQFANGSFKAIKLVEKAVVWIPYGWVAMMVHCSRDISNTLVIPYLNAKLALGYPSMGMLVSFHMENVKANQQKGMKHWTEHGDSFCEWLGNLNCEDDIQAQQAGIHAILSSQPALMDGVVDDPDSLPRDSQAELDMLGET